MKKENSQIKWAVCFRFNIKCLHNSELVAFNTRKEAKEYVLTKYGETFDDFHYIKVNIKPCPPSKN